MESQLNSEPVNKEIKLDFKEGKYSTGRRKKSIARVWLKKGSGNINVNGKKMINYLSKLNSVDVLTAIYQNCFRKRLTGGTTHEKINS